MRSTSHAGPRSLGVAIVTAVALLALSACGSDEVAERGLEELIEREGGGNVDLDLDSGGFSFESEDGSVRMDDDGNIVITDQDGETIVGGVDEEGNFSAESEDGSFSIGADGELPDDWPADVPEPDGLQVASAVSTSDGDDIGFVVAGGADADFVDRYGAALESAGFVLQSESSSEVLQQRSYENDTWGVSVGSVSDGGDVQATVTVFALG